MQFHFPLQVKINALANILNNYSPCIDLIFNSQPNLLTDSDVDSSLQVY